MKRMWSALILVMFIAVLPLSGAEQTLGESVIRFVAADEWENHKTVKGAVVEAECDLRWKFPPAAQSGLLFLSARAVLFATYDELTLEEARDSILDNVKANQRLGNSDKVVSSRQLGPAAWWVVIDQSGMVLGARPGDAPSSVHLDHHFVYFTLGTKMTIQVSEFFPVNEPKRHQELQAEIIKLVSSFTDNGTPMFVFEKAKPGKKK